MNSPLVTRDWPADPSNYSAGRPNGPIRGIVIHHAASTSLNSVGQVFSTPGRGGSAHYGVCGNEVHQYVNENDTAWHCSNWWGNTVTIGIEMVNSAGAPDWPVSDATMEKTCQLVAEIAKRRGLGNLYYAPAEDCSPITGHKDWQGAATACPGPYVYARLQYICDRANQINNPPAPAPTTPVWVDMTPDEYVAADGRKETYLYDVLTGTKVKTYGPETRITLVQKTDWNGVIYYRTDWSKQKDINNGFKADEMKPYVEPEPEPTPEPEPEPEPEPTPEPDPGDDTPNWFIRFIHALGEFFTHLFTRKDK